MFAIFLVPAGLTYAFGRMVKNQKHGWALWAAMFVLFMAGTTTAYWAEARGNPIHAAHGVNVLASATNPGGNMEGKEVRFGIANSALFATITTDASCGAVNAMHDSFTPIGGLVPMMNIQLGEVVFGGVGAGLYGMLVMVVLTVFIAGLMVGRTPEYLGKKIQAREVQMAMLFVLVFAAAILANTAVAASIPAGLAGLNNAGPHGLSEILYAFSLDGRQQRERLRRPDRREPTSTTRLLGLNTLVGRFAMIVPMLALAGFLAEKKAAPESAGDLPGHDSAVRRAPHRRDPHRRRAHVLPGALARPDRRALPDAGGEALLTWPSPSPSSVRSRRSSAAPSRDAVQPSSRRATWCGTRSCSWCSIGSVLTTLVLVRDIAHGLPGIGFTLQIAVWLWFTVLFANFAEAMARGARQGAGRQLAQRAYADGRPRNSTIRRNKLAVLAVPASQLRVGDFVICTPGDVIPGDGEVVEGVASVDESAITGESAPVIRESGGDRSAVTGGTKVLSDYLVIDITANPGETFLDRMIALVEGATRQKTPNEIALTILLSGLTIVFLLAVGDAAAVRDLQRRRPFRCRS